RRSRNLPRSMESVSVASGALTVALRRPPSSRTAISPTTSPRPRTPTVARSPSGVVIRIATRPLSMRWRVSPGSPSWKRTSRRAKRRRRAVDSTRRRSSSERERSSSQSAPMVRVSPLRSPDATTRSPGPGLWHTGPMSTETLVTVGRVGALWRYPVKSMLGEPLTSVDVSDAGFDGDRRFGVVDAGTGRIASAKRPRRWQRLLQLRAERAGAGAVRIRFPDGTSVVSGKDGPEDGTADVDAALTAFLGTDVRLRGEAPAGAEIERSVPEEVLAAGADADVGFTMLEMAAASPPGTFFDFSPLQLVTTASLDRAGAA